MDLIAASFLNSMSDSLVGELELLSIGVLIRFPYKISSMPDNSAANFFQLHSGGAIASFFICLLKKGA